MAISNEIFEHYRKNEKEVKKAARFLRRNGYSVKKLLKNKDKL